MFRDEPLVHHETYYQFMEGVGEITDAYISYLVKRDCCHKLGNLTKIKAKSKDTNRPKNLNRKMQCKTAYW